VQQLDILCLHNVYGMYWCSGLRTNTIIGVFCDRKIV
jgi:hypothetical protein